MFLFGTRNLNTATRADLKKLYRTQRSFADLLPWVEYLPESRQILFNDGISRMAVLDIEPIPTEGRSQAFLETVMRDLASVISESFPEEDRDPWTVQFFVNSENDLGTHLASLKKAIEPAAIGSTYTDEYVRLYESHLAEITRSSGYFHDSEVIDAPWRGKWFQARVCIYRRYWSTHPRTNPEHELEQVVEKFQTGLQATGIVSRRADGGDFYRWMLSWFNPAPSEYAREPARMLRELPYPGDEDLPLSRDLAEMVLLNPPDANRHRGLWFFDDRPHTVVQLGKLQRRPACGAMTGEIPHGDRIYALTDRLPENAIIGMTVFILPQDTIKNRVKLISDRAIGDSAESGITRQEAAKVLEKQARADRLFPMEAAIYLHAADERELSRHVVKTRALLGNLGLQTLNPEKDPIALDNFIKNLPGVQVEALDRAARQRSRLAFSTNIAALAPLYGRSRGTGNPGLLFFNRTGEPLVADLLHNQDRRKNAHMLVLGPTGAGKSATLISILMSMMAIHRPRIYIIEAGNSFGLFGDHAAEHGLSVHKVALTFASNIAIPPFSDAIRLAEDQDAKLKAEQTVREELDAGTLDDEDAYERDLLGEAELIAILMITGGEEKEAEKLSRWQRMAIRRAIVLAAQRVHDRPADAVRTVLPTDIAAALYTLSDSDEYADARRELREMGDSMQMFCDGLNGRLFNREGSLWPQADITIIDMAQAAQKGNEDTLAVAYTSLIQHINAEVEQDQMRSRNTIVLTDEGHIITRNPLLMPYVVSITKMWRKLGAWYWLGTQNTGDFPDSAETLLNMIEWWLCLTMPPDEIEQISRFKSLTEEQKAMMRSCTKEPRKYTEGVLLSDQLQTLFRNVPPPLALALAQTEKHEKAARRALMDEHGITEVQAAYRIAAEMISSGRKAQVTEPIP